MSYVYLACFLAGLLFAVRLMFFGAERRRLPTVSTLPLRRSEPAAVAFVSMFGASGYLLLEKGGVSLWVSLLGAISFALAFAAVATRMAIAFARITPEYDPDDPRYVYQGVVGVVVATIPVNGNGRILFNATECAARNILEGSIAEGEEVCIERVEDGVAYVELWSLVEERL